MYCAGQDDYVAGLVETFRGVRRVLADDGVLFLIIGDGSKFGSAWSVAFGLSLDGWDFKREIIWARARDHERIFVMSKGQDISLAKTVWTVPPAQHAGTPYGTFPEELIEPLILATSEPGDTVLDPFCGSGTTGIVAARHGRDFIGIEIDAASADWARHRISESSVSTP